MTLRLCKVCRDWHQPGDWPEGCMDPVMLRPGKRGNYPLPAFTRDNIRPVQSQVDGKTYDSRAALYGHYEASGVRVLDDGERSGPPPIEKTTDAEIRQALKAAKLA